MATTRITITRVSYVRQQEPDVNRQLQMIGAALGLFNQRDRDHSRFRIFVALVRDLRGKKDGLSTDDLAGQLGLTRATVIHHLTVLADAGLIIENIGKYALPFRSLEELIRTVKEDLDKTLSELQVLARHVDEELGLH